MAFPLAAIPIIGSIIEKVMDKVAPDKLSDEQRLRLQAEVEKALREDDADIDKAFREFVVQYEGAAVDMPRFIQVLRGSVRPVLTYAATFYFGYIVHMWLTSGTMPGNSELAIKLVFYVTTLMLFFWFGERAVQRSGVGEFLKDWGNNKK